MCGIAGYADFERGTPSREVLLKMAHVLRRRGPDAQGIMIDGPCGLAHARLSIIDLAGSPQPMRVSNSRLSLVYNGELYNYRELRSDLECQDPTIEFDTNGDTEVILRWVEKDWEQALTRFDGMFGFAAWHSARQVLLLGRDPLGIKPLYYATPRPGVIVFGSEVKAVLAHPEVSGDLDEDSLRQVLRFRAVYGQGSLYRGVKQLDPGTSLEFDGSRIRIHRYFDIFERAAQASEQIQSMNEAQIIDEGQQRLERAVRKRLIADVPVGAFLSGGLDSSVISAIIRRTREPGEAVHTFSVGFDGDASSELPFARMVADAIGSQHTEVRLGEEDYIKLFGEMTVCRDAPVSEPADLAVARMSDVARNQVKVVLSGEGADEVFAGYPKYGFAGAPRALSWALRMAGPTRAAWLAGVLGLNRRRATVACRAIAHRDELDRMVQWFSYLDRSTLHTLLPGLEWSADQWNGTVAPQRQALAGCNGMSSLARMQAVDCLTWLPCNMLERGDRMTMAYGLEMRVPFLDKALAPFGLALADRMKVRGRTSKWIVRQWADKLLPAQIRDRKKWGFRVPLDKWFRGRLRPLVSDYLSSRDGLCGTYGDRAAIGALVDAHQAGRVDANLELWTLLAAEIWYQDVYRAAAGQGDADMSPAVVGLN